MYCRRCDVFFLEEKKVAWGDCLFIIGHCPKCNHKLMVIEKRQEVSEVTGQAPQGRKRVPAINPTKCDCHGKCLTVCEKVNAVAMRSSGVCEVWKPVVDFDRCNSCGRCAEVCPKKAIEMQEFYGMVRALKEYCPQSPGVAEEQAC